MSDTDATSATDADTREWTPAAIRQLVRALDGIVQLAGSVPPDLRAVFRPVLDVDALSAGVRSLDALVKGALQHYMSASGVDEALQRLGARLREGPLLNGEALLFAHLFPYVSMTDEQAAALRAALADDALFERVQAVFSTFPTEELARTSGADRPPRSAVAPDFQLPGGWTVREHKRDCGHVDHYYFSPAGLRFRSRAEVARYLETLPASSP